jgi:hypothetical protein
MRTGYLPKFAVAILVLAVAVVFLSGQFGQAAAMTSSPQACSYYGYYSSSYYYWYWYPYYYYYSYPYYYCYDGYYGYYGYYYYAYDYSYYTPSQYKLTVATDPSNLGTVTGSGTFNDGTSASFSITQSVIQASSNTRYVFSHWSGDYSGVGDSGMVTMNGAKKIVAVYQLQYYLSVGVQPQSVPLPQGQGWYNAGDSVTLTSAGQTLGGDGGSRLVFQGWNVDGQNTQAGVSVTLPMNAPHSATAQYKQQYYLKVLTDQGVAYGEGWYDAGTTAQVYVSTPVSTSYGVSIIFNGWQGDIQSNSQSTNVVMDKAKTLIASWRTDSTVLYLTIALGVVAALLVVAGIIVYLAPGGRFRGSRSTPGSGRFSHAPETPAKTKSLPLKKKSTPESTGVDSATA